MLACNAELDEMNVDPNGIDPANGNPTLVIPTVLHNVARPYIKDLGYGKIAGVVQHLQEDAWNEGYNQYDWTQEDWNTWYDQLRNNQYLYERSVELDYKFHQGVALTMKSFIFGLITDLWGDAPYTEALKGDKEEAILFPKYDSQEVIYNGVIEDLKAAIALFETGDKSGYASGYDIFYDGDTEQWKKFAGTLILRYSMRVSEKLPELAKSNIEAIYSSGNHMKTPDDDATMEYIGTNADNSWPNAVEYDASESNWRRRRPAKTFIEALRSKNDPRMQLWFQPVHVQWVVDKTLKTGMDEFIREDGKIMPDVTSLSESELQNRIAQGRKYTRHFNPDLYVPSNAENFAGPIDTSLYVGVPHGMRQTTFFNENPTTGQVVHNQHASQLSNIFKGSKGGLLKARIASASETSFILAEAALKGWGVGSAEEHYKNGVKNSFTSWGLDSEYARYIAGDKVAYSGELGQILEQKWIAGFTTATEAWFDFRRTGFPKLTPGPASAQPVLPVRFMYGNNELNNNSDNVKGGLTALEETQYSKLAANKNSQWAKPWLLQGTGKPW